MDLTEKSDKKATASKKKKSVTSNVTLSQDAYVAFLESALQTKL